MNTALNNVGVGRSALEALVSGNNNIAIGYKALMLMTAGGENIGIGTQTLDAIDGTEVSNIAIGSHTMGAVDEGSHGSALANFNIALGDNALLGGSFGSSDLDLLGNIAIGHYAMQSTSTNAQTGTVAIGHSALTALTSGASNTAVGYEAGNDLTTGAYNTIFGYQALDQATTSANDNVAVGINAMGGSIVAEAVIDCVVVGSGALAGSLESEASGSTAIGKAALAAVTTGAGNTAVGYQSLTVMTTGDRNTAIGWGSMVDTSGAGAYDSDDNVGIGAYCMGGNWATTKSIKNVAVGAFSMGGAMVGCESNTAVGYGALGVITTGNGNVAIGHQALDAARYGEESNVAIGPDAMGAAAEHSSASAINQNVAIGTNALLGGAFTGANNLLQNVAIGHACMDGTGANPQTGTVGVGAFALSQLTTGAGNTALGYESADALTTGQKNTAVGYGALSASVDGSYNSVFGYNAFANFEGASDGGEDAIFGYNAGLFVSTAVNTTFIGSQAGQGHTDARLTGSHNTAVGSNAGLLLQGAATQNALIGMNAGNVITTGTNNTCLGHEADTDDATATNQSVIGQGTTGVADNSVTLGNASVDKLYAAQDGGAVISAGGLGIGLAAVAPSNTIHMKFDDSSGASSGNMTGNSVRGIILENINGDGNTGSMIAFRSTGAATGDAFIWSENATDGNSRLNIWTEGSGTITKRFEVQEGGDTYTNDGSVSSLSDVRVKKNIQDLSDGLSIVNQLKPRTFEYNGSTDMTPDDGVTRYGFIADEVLEVASQYVTIGREIVEGEAVDDFKSLSTGRMIPMMLKAIQELSAKVKALEDAQ